MKIGDRIKALREALGMSQAELARQVEHSRGVVFGWESGRNRPEQESMLKLARVLKTSVSYLYGETADPRPAADWHSTNGPSNETEARMLQAAVLLQEALAIMEVAKTTYDGTPMEQVHENFAKYGEGIEHKDAAYKFRKSPKSKKNPEAKE